MACPICALHACAGNQELLELGRSGAWLLRHHPHPAPLSGWFLLDSRRHLPGPMAFNDGEAISWGPAVRQASQLVQHLTGSDRVYMIGFGEGAPHLHLHLIPRFAADPASAAWRVADLYRAVERGERPAADPASVAALVAQGRSLLALNPLPDPSVRKHEPIA